MLDKNGIIKTKEVPFDILESARLDVRRTGDHRIRHPLPGGEDGSEKRRRGIRRPHESNSERLHTRASEGVCPEPRQRSPPPCLQMERRSDQP